MRKITTYFIAFVWFVNGFYCKILNQVPRHEQIVSTILNIDNARLFTVLIGVSEIIMTFWILSNYKTKLNALLQISIILIMNVLEYAIVPDLLLWGKFNIVFAILFTSLIYCNQFKIKTA